MRPEVTRSAAVQVFFAPNVWPGAHAPDLQPSMESIYARCTGIADALLRVFAVALEAPEDFFADKTDTHHSNLQVATPSSVTAFIAVITLITLITMHSSATCV